MWSSISTVGLTSFWTISLTVGSASGGERQGTHVVAEDPAVLEIRLGLLVDLARVCADRLGVQLQPRRRAPDPHPPHPPEDQLLHPPPDLLLHPAPQPA